MGDHATINTSHFVSQYERPGCCRRCLLSLRGGVVRCLESFFFRYGKFVARRPGFVIFLATAVALGCGAGCRYLRQENEGIKVRVFYMK